MISKKSLKNISIKKLNIIYEKIRKKNKICLNYSGIFNYLNLSIHFSRDERDFDIANYKLFKDLKLSNKKGFDKLNNYYNEKFYINYFKNFKEYNYLISKKIFLVICDDILKFNIKLLDTFGVFFITLIRSILNTLINEFDDKKNFVNKKFYSTTYWNLRREKSSSYYYPNINSDENSIAFITSFAADFRGLFSVGLFKCLKSKRFLSPLNTLGLLGFLISIFQFIHLYLNDLYLGLFNKNCTFIKFWYGWKKISEIFYSILLYNSLVKIVQKSSECEFISWYENQVTNRAFSLGVTYGIRKFHSSSILSTYNGSPFSINNKAQYFPKINEHNIGFWGDKYYLQDKDSMNEMKKYINAIGLKLKLEVVEKDMLRSTNLIRENLGNNKYKDQITIFTHDSYWDMVACILAIINPKNKDCSLIRKLIKKNNMVFIRLHPDLNKVKALKEISKYPEIPLKINFRFVDFSEESITNTIKKSSYCIFGLSSYINIALSFDKLVFAVNTNHVDKCPINSNKKKFITSSNLNPW